MGVSTDGLLYFGFDFHNEDGGGGEIPFPDFDWKAVFAERSGFVDTSTLFDKVTGKYAVDQHKDPDEYQKRYKIWSENHDKKSALIKACPATIAYHSSSEDSIWYVTLKAKSFTAHRGDSVKLSSTQLEKPSDEEIAKLKDFCELMSIEWQEPSWHLASYWG